MNRLPAVALRESNVVLVTVTSASVETLAVRAVTISLRVNFILNIVLLLSFCLFYPDVETKGK